MISTRGGSLALGTGLYPPGWLRDLDAGFVYQMFSLMGGSRLNRELHAVEDATKILGQRIKSPDAVLLNRDVRALLDGTDRMMVLIDALDVIRRRSQRAAAARLVRRLALLYARLEARERLWIDTHWQLSIEGFTATRKFRARRAP